MRIRSDAPTQMPTIDSQEPQQTTTAEKASSSSQAQKYQDTFEKASPTAQDSPGVAGARGFKHMGKLELKPTAADLDERRGQAVDEIGRGYLGHGGPYQNFESTAKDIYKKEGAEGLERFRQDIDAELKKNFGSQAKLDFEIQTLKNGTVFLDIQQTRPHPKGGMNRTTGGLVLSTSD